MITVFAKTRRDVFQRTERRLHPAPSPPHTHTTLLQPDSGRGLKLVDFRHELVQLLQRLALRRHRLHSITNLR